jgi:protein-S-isoprenylcysteine O-methyltransferase Ste14
MSIGGLFSIHGRITIGRWLHRYRQWGLFPLLGLGLLLNTHFVPVRSSNYMMVAGAIGILFGSLLRIVCYTFAGGKDVVDEASGTLMTEGPYAISRNPVYLAEAGIALGIAMMSRMPWLVLATLVAFAFLTALVIEWEEETLRARFGSVFAEYCRSVPRWFSFRRLTHADSYKKTRGRVKLLTAVRAESGTLLVGLLSILAFLAKADIEFMFFKFFTP